MAATIKTKEVRNRTYLGKDFDGFRSKLLSYAQQYYPDQIKDFSEASMGGLLLDFASYVGDSMSFYLDHQFTELDPETVIETSNIERMLRSSGVPITGASPAIVDETFYIEVPSLNGSPREDCLPIIKTNSTVQSNSGISFILTDDIDFSVKTSSGQYLAQVKPGKVSNGTVNSFIMSNSGVCISGYETTETFTLSGFTPFRKLTLSNPDVTEIVSVIDSSGNVYYNVSALTDDVVYKNSPNPNSDVDQVPDVVTVIPAPYRFTTETSLSDRTTTLIMGGGSAATFDDDAIPDPSEFAIPMRYHKTFSRISIDPEQLISTKTLGIVAANVTLSVTYRFGGGLNNCVPANSIQATQTLLVTFPLNPPINLSRSVRDSIEVNNLSAAKDGDDAPTIDTLKSLIPSSRNSQERIVTRNDLLARVYTMPSNFGRVFRATIKPNPNNPLSIQLHVISRDINNRLTTCSDSLKKNLRTILNPYRMISDAIEILDMRVLDVQIKFEVFVDPVLNKSLVIQACLDSLKRYFDIKKWQCDQPIIVSDVWNALMAVQGVIAVNQVQFIPVSGITNGMEYSNDIFDVDSNTQKGFIMTPTSGASIFEVRYPNVDIIGKGV